MKFRNIAVVGILLIAAGAVIYGWFRYVSHPNPVACSYCMRPLHANLRVTAEIAGKRAQVCCARCAISEANQEHKPLHLIEVHDYSTGKAVTPERAWFVEGSRAMACDHDAMRMDEMKQTQELAYDRCSPGTFSFANKSDADAFVATNGGTVLSFAQLMSEVHFK
jgi:hypothetical protein